MLPPAADVSAGRESASESEEVGEAGVALEGELEVPGKSAESSCGPLPCR